MYSGFGRYTFADGTVYTGQFLVCNPIQSNPIQSIELSVMIMMMMNDTHTPFVFHHMLESNRWARRLDEASYASRVATSTIRTPSLQSKGAASCRASPHSSTAIRSFNCAPYRSTIGCMRDPERGTAKALSSVSLSLSVCVKNENPREVLLRMCVQCGACSY